MLMPKRVMRRYVHRGKRRGKPLRGSQINFGEYGLQAMEAGWITNNQIESARIAITRYVRRGGKLGSRSFRTNHSVNNLLKPAWARAKKVRPNTGSLWLNPAESFLN